MASNQRQILTIFLEEFFIIGFIALIVGFVLEIIFPNIVLAYFNINYLLILWLFAGIVLLTIKK